MTTTIEERTGPAPPLLLELDQPEGGQSEAYVPLVWCPTKAGREAVIRNGIEDPYVFIVIEHDGQETGRYLFPLFSRARYIAFTRPGRNVVHATIVGGEKVKKYLTKPGFSGYQTTALRGRQFRVEALEHQLDQARHVLFERQSEIDALVIETDDQRAVREELMERTREMNDQLAAVRDQHPLFQHHGGNLGEAREALRNLNGQLKLAGKQYEEAVDLDELTARRDEAKAEVERLYRELDEARETDPVVYNIEVWSVGKVSGEAVLEVPVPEQMFAGEHPFATRVASIRQWEGEPRDECHLRKRAWAAAGSAPFIAFGAFFAEIANLLVIGALLFAGKRNIDYTPLQHPLTYPFWDCWSHLEPSRWYTEEKVEEDGLTYHPQRAWYYSLIAPPFLVAVLLGLVATIWIVGVLPVLATVGAILVAATLVMLVSAASNAVNARRAGRRYDRAAAKRERQRRIHAEDAARRRQQEQERERRLAERLEAIACETQVGTPSVGEVIAERKSVPLLFQKAKAKVCRPFAT